MKGEKKEYICDIWMTSSGDEKSPCYPYEQFKFSTSVDFDSLHNVALMKYKEYRSCGAIADIVFTTPLFDPCGHCVCYVCSRDGKERILKRFFVSNIRECVDAKSLMITDMVEL